MFAGLWPYTVYTVTLPELVQYNEPPRQTFEHSAKNHSWYVGACGVDCDVTKLWLIDCAELFVILLHGPPFIVGDNVAITNVCSNLVAHPPAVCPLVITKSDVEVPDTTSLCPMVNVMYESVLVVEPELYGEQNALDDGPELTDIWDVGLTTTLFFLTTVLPTVVPLPGW